jgi:hypothetical protein
MFFKKEGGLIIRLLDIYFLASVSLVFGTSGFGCAGVVGASEAGVTAVKLWYKLPSVASILAIVSASLECNSAKVLIALLSSDK